MRIPFCDYHICALLEIFSKSNRPLDQTLGDYFRSHKSIGAHDRRNIAEALYGMVRWKRWIETFCRSDVWLDRLHFFRTIDFSNSKVDDSIKSGLSEFLYQQFVSHFGKEKAHEICAILQKEAPTTIRVNELKISREQLAEKWKDKFQFRLCKCPTAISFLKREPLFALPEFKEGLFEVQDEGSQMVARLVQAKPGNHFLDYCSGSGGKTLAIAPQMLGKGQIYLHDNRPWILIDAKKRMKRAGIQNVQFCLPKQKVDWVLADVPCSGTGTFRRNPDSKWKMDSQALERLVEVQKEIVKEAFEYVKPGGYFVYATCSILPCENENQIDHFLKNFPCTFIEQLSLLPQEGGPDGFFAAVLKKTDRVF